MSDVLEIEPESLSDRTITAVEYSTHYDSEPRGFAEIKLTLDDGREVYFTSCSCCGGMELTAL